MATAEVITIPKRASKPTSRVVFTEGGKGGVGKSAFMSALVEWYERANTPYALLDLDTENKARGSLKHYFPGTRKVDIRTSEGLDAFVDVLDECMPIVLADMGAGAGAGAHRWFDSMFSSVDEMGVAFTAVGVVTGPGERRKRSELGESAATPG